MSVAAVASDEFVIIADVEGAIRFVDRDFKTVKKFHAYLLACQLIGASPPPPPPPPSFLEDVFALDLLPLLFTSLLLLCSSIFSPLHS